MSRCPIDRDGGLVYYIDIRYTDTRYNDLRYTEIDLDDKMPENLSRYLPLSEATAYILMTLSEPLHGYGIMQKIEALTQGTVKVGPGTLYGALSKLEKQGLISMVDEKERRKIYLLSPKGKQVLRLHIERSRVIVENGQRILAALEQSG